MADPTATDAAEPGTGASAESGGAAPDAGADLGRRRFFRQFAGDIASTAATLVGTAQALQRTSAELAGAILDPVRDEPAAAEGPTVQPADRGPVFRTAFRIEGSTITFVDQRALPGRLVEHAAGSAADVTWAIRNGTLNGGPAAGQSAAIGMALTAARLRGTKPYARRATFRGAANALRNAAPTNGSVATALERVMGVYARIGELSEDGDAIAGGMRAEADAIVAEAVADHGALVEAGVAWLATLPRNGEEPLRLVVHGPGGTLAGGQFGTALSIAITAHQQEIPIRVIVPEGRPRFVGSRISSWELAAAAVPHVLVADAAAPSLIAKADVDAILVPADRVAANGDVAAAIGTYPLAVVANRHGVPVVACVAASVIDPSSKDGSAMSIGSFDADEVDRFEKHALAPPGTETRAPTHDVTPAELITTWLVATGPRRPPFEALPGDPDPAPAEEPA
ncbi:MAG TPA: hypothetical protein VFV72_16060 [Candidatus Limnocylindrales bacterium]|nr:hypothetical protein [Candidatus Limnocylindrales bacterium]